MSHGRHAAPTIPVVTRERVLATGGLVAVAAGVGQLAAPTPAAAAPGHDWSGVANCESSGNWHINTGNGFYGGLQFTRSTWDAFGGGAYASRADLASEGQQVVVAERVLATQGPHAWPHCHIFLQGGSTPAPAVQAVPAPRPAAEHRVVVVNGQPGRHSAPVHPSDTPAGQYVVVSGDCLSKIAAVHRVTTAALYNANRAVVGGNENLIFPGQVLRLPGSAVVPAPAAPASAPAPHVRIAPRVGPSHAAPVTDPLPGHRVSSHTTTPGIQEVDLAAPLGTPVYAAAAGIVAYAAGSGVQGFGGWIVVRSAIDGVSHDFVYGHEFPSGILVHPGEAVQAGDMIGRVGANGNATGPHVCFWVWRGGVSHGTVLDPVPFMAAHGVSL